MTGGGKKERKKKKKKRNKETKKQRKEERKKKKKQTNKQTNKQTKIERKKQTNKQTNKESKKQKKIFYGVDKISFFLSSKKDISLSHYLYLYIVQICKSTKHPLFLHQEPPSPPPVYLKFWYFHPISTRVLLNTCLSLSHSLTLSNSLSFSLSLLLSPYFFISFSQSVYHHLTVDNN